MEKYFDEWNEIKKKISKTSVKNKFLKEGDVWIGNIGVNLGYEQGSNNSDFSRPFLIIKKFNNKMFWAVPLSTKQKSFDFYFNYEDSDMNSVSAILAQMRLISIKRLQRKLYSLDSILMEKIKLKIMLLLKQ